ncbi:hypothetical protein RJT34_27229 [Clitoria ternatea]|uniref:Uncharacterized protein n=1 Tax=Clitoria ternatea TaxID=43366 RepID=A0AAN9FGB0_CLITE
MPFEFDITSLIIEIFPYLYTITSTLIFSVSPLSTALRSASTIPPLSNLRLLFCAWWPMGFCDGGMSVMVVIGGPWVVEPQSLEVEKWMLWCGAVGKMEYWWG